MTGSFDECINHKPIKQELTSLSFKTKGVEYNIKIGDVFNKLTVKELVRYDENGTTRKGCICECECGNFIGPSRIHMLVNGELQSCGCYSNRIHSSLMKQRNTKHGFATRNKKEHLYVLWCAMRDRAQNPNRRDSIYYSDKGIDVCEEWNDYLKFKEWAFMNGYQEGLSIDRKDNNMGYCPENCRWIPLREQNRNKTTNRILTYKDRSQNITDWCRELNLHWSTINRRLKAGKSVGQALGLEK